MALTPEQERAFVADLERRGVTQVRRDLDHGQISPALVYLATDWLSGKEREAAANERAFRSEQIEIARAAAAEAKRASDAAERQAAAAERANTRATIALVIAIISMIISASGILWSHWDVDDRQKGQTKVQTKTH